MIVTQRSSPPYTYDSTFWLCSRHSVGFERFHPDDLDIPCMVSIHVIPETILTDGIAPARGLDHKCRFRPQFVKCNPFYIYGTPDKTACATRDRQPDEAWINVPLADHTIVIQISKEWTRVDYLMGKHKWYCNYPPLPWSDTDTVFNQQVIDFYWSPDTSPPTSDRPGNMA